MQLAWDEHFTEIVVPAWQEYLQAESRLTAAIGGAHHHRARYDALRHGAAAAIFLHHFAETVHRAMPGFLPALATTKPREQLEEIRGHLSGSCLYLRSTNKCEDVQLLGDVADALKHAVLTIKVEQRQVAAADAVLVVNTGFAQLPYAEGKYGGVEQVVILAKDRPRALSVVLQNVVDAWRRLAGMEMPGIGKA